MPLARSWRVAAACVLGVAFLLPAPALADAGTAGAGGAGAPVRWRQCDGGECAELRVPLDYANPDDGRTIDVALFRVPATEPEARIGSLLMNPGGPGASGVDFVRQVAFAIPDPIRRRFDLVGFDPRGAGETAPVKCRRSLDSLFALDFSPDDAAEEAALDGELQRLVGACERRNGDVLPYLSSDSTVRDMDRIRAALGDDGLSYVGFSYGTYLGALYAERFPDRVRALVLDGAVDPTLDRLQVNVQQAAGFESSLDAFFAWCAGDDDCGFGGGDPAGAYDRLVRRIDRRPVRVDDRRLGPGELDLAVFSYLYDGELSYASLADALAAAADGDGAPLLAEADDFTGRRDDGSYSNEQEAFWAIGCLDGPRLGGPEAYRAAEPEVAAAAPRLGRANLNYDRACAHWPVPAVAPPGPLTAAGAAPILVIGTTGDPATPIQWGRDLAAALESGVFVEVEGTTHTSFLSLDECVDRLVSRYLVRLEVPPAGTKCAA
jgi:pimeloyl-ACP methyl ester carboxylesterase